jgi:hypothetical protein
MLVNSAFRLGYGVAGLLAPSAMAAAGMAPDTEERPDARLFVRGFSAHQLAVGALGVLSWRRRRWERPAIVLAIVLDAVDLAAAAVEARARGRMDADLLGGFALSAAGLATAGPALREL